MKPLKNFLLAASAALFSITAFSQPTDLFISEYIEGSSFNKALEIYNGTSNAIDLGLGQYNVQVYFNGATSSTSVALAGTLQAGGVYIIAHPQATLGITPTHTTTAINFNGNDAVELRKNGVAGTLLDAIGQVGFNPGTQWGSGDTATLDRTMRRKVNVCSGDNVSSNVYYTGPQWDGYPQNTFGGLGSHTVSCASTGGTLSATPSSLNFTAIANIASLPQTYALNSSSLGASVNLTVSPLFQISLSATGPFSSSLTVPALSFSAGAISIHTRYFPLSAGTNTGAVYHTSGTTTLNVLLSGVALSITPVCQIQGTAAASTYTGQVIATQGIVTGDYQAANELGGFFIQTPGCDANPMSSDGLFVLHSSYSVNAGDLVTLSGTVEEFFGRTQIKTLTSINAQTNTLTVPALTLTLPVAVISDYESKEGMYVQFQQTLTVTEVYTLGRFGEVSLSANGRLYTPTEFVDPNDQPASGNTFTGISNVSAVLAQQNLNDRSRILLDDRSNIQNPPIVPYIDPVDKTLRCGSSISNLSGVLDFAFGVYRVQPIANPVFNYAPRPAVPSVGNPNIKVASFNVLNYFNGDGLGGGYPTSRGANTAAEFTRQRDKIIEALKQLNADAVGLMEIENDGDSTVSALQDLVDGLNSVMGSGTYTFVPDPTSSNGGTGTDAIKVAMIYKPASLSLVGNSFSDIASVHNRPPLAQIFLSISNNEKFAVIVNHFKSKSCSGSTGNNTDQNDGQSCYNDTRKLQAAALASFVNTVTAQALDNDVLIIGDINAYAEEDPSDFLKSSGFSNISQGDYSYVFMGQSGSLDHAFASPSITNQVTGVQYWHINADEPVVKDYNQEFNPLYVYTPDAFRSSDHDPVIIGLSLGNIVTDINSHQGAIFHDLRMYPNPAADKAVTVEFYLLQDETITLTITDQFGRITSRDIFAGNIGLNQTIISPEKCTSGVNMIVIKSKSATRVGKLFK